MSTHLQRLTESTLDHCQIYPEQKAAILYGFVHLTHEDLRAKSQIIFRNQQLLIFRPFKQTAHGAKDVELVEMPPELSAAL